MSEKDKDEVPWKTFGSPNRGDSSNETGVIIYAVKHAGFVAIYTFVAAGIIAAGFAGGGDALTNYSLMVLGVVTFVSGTLGMLYKVVADGVADGIDS